MSRRRKRGPVRPHYRRGRRVYRTARRTAGTGCLITVIQAIMICVVIGTMVGCCIR